MQKAEIKDWMIVGARGKERLTGIIVEHPQFEKDEIITTGIVKSVDLDQGIVTTKNTEYFLQEKINAVAPEFWFYDLKCQNCKNIDSFPGPRREDTTWAEFVDMLRRSPEYNLHFRYCKECKKVTRTSLIAYEAE